MSTNLKNHHLLALCLALISLSFAYYVEYVMGLAVCPLCIYQRFPYLILITLAIIGLAGDQKLLGSYLLVFFLSMILAFYHSGIERGLFELSVFCKSINSFEHVSSLHDFQNMLYNKQLGMCNKPALIIFSLSMAQWNLLLNAILFVLFLILYKKTRDEKHA